MPTTMAVAGPTAGDAGAVDLRDSSWLRGAYGAWAAAPARVSLAIASESAALGAEFRWRRDIAHRRRAAAVARVLLRGGDEADPDGGAFLRAANAGSGARMYTVPDSTFSTICATLPSLISFFLQNLELRNLQH